MITLKTESDQSTIGGLIPTKKSIPYNFSSPNLFKENNNVTFIKEKIKKSKHLND